MDVAHYDQLRPETISIYAAAYEVGLQMWFGTLVNYCEKDSVWFSLNYKHPLRLVGACYRSREKWDRGFSERSLWQRVPLVQM